MLRFCRREIRVFEDTSACGAVFLPFSYQRHGFSPPQPKTMAVLRNLVRMQHLLHLLNKETVWKLLADLVLFAVRTLLAMREESVGECVEMSIHNSFCPSTTIILIPCRTITTDQRWISSMNLWKISRPCELQDLLSVCLWHPTRHCLLPCSVLLLYVQSYVYSGHRCVAAIPYPTSNSSFWHHSANGIQPNILISSLHVET